VGLVTFHENYRPEDVDSGLLWPHSKVGFASMPPNIAAVAHVTTAAVVTMVIA
jgi:hypothetical protein